MSTLFLTANTPLKFLVEEIPKWTPILERFGINCKAIGAKTLEEACAENGLSRDKVLEQLLNYNFNKGRSDEDKGDVE